MQTRNCQISHADAAGGFQRVLGSIPGQLDEEVPEWLRGPLRQGIESSANDLARQPLILGLVFEAEAEIGLGDHGQAVANLGVTWRRNPCSAAPCP
jgi:hypothetical protein